MAKAHSPLLTSLLALSASTIWLPGEVFVSLDELLREHPVRKFGLLIKEMRFLLPQKFVFHSISNTPFSELDICVAGASWTCGQTRVAATVHSSTRPEVIIDEKSESISEALINNACSQYLQPKKPTEYQNKTTKILITRTILELK